MSESTEALERKYARDNGHHYLGRGEQFVEVNLTGQEVLELGKEQTKSIYEIRRLQSEIDQLKNKFKSEIGTHEAIINDTAKLIKNGYKLKKKDLPIFLDPKKKMKFWFDMDTHEIVKEQEATQQDIQTSLLNK